MMIKFKEMKLHEEERIELIDSCIEVIDSNIEILDYDAENNSLKLLGFTCSYELLNSIYTSLFTLALATGQSVYNKIAGT